LGISNLASKKMPEVKGDANRVVLTVIAHRMSPGDNLPEEFRERGGSPSQAKEASGNSILMEDFEYTRGEIWVRPIIKRKGHDPFPGLCTNQDGDEQTGILVTASQQKSTKHKECYHQEGKGWHG
jgi:hypothetical protein